jgi:2,3-bisphosphoglycerate-independent phosphoglycerate mutase
MIMKTTKPIVLCILDGWGISEAEEGNAVAMAKTPVTDRLLAEFPHSRIDASGEAVGLPQGQMGNSEVGHTNLGAGRVVYQELTRISKAIHDGDFFTNPVLVDAVRAGRDGALHLMGLVSDGGVHSHMEHLKALVELARREGVERVFIHAFLDGRDTTPRGGAGYIAELQGYLAQVGLGEIATLTGRYFAMDRDKRWDRVEKAFRALAFGEGLDFTDPVKTLEAAYAADETDEFVKPRILHKDGKAVGSIGPDDSVICFNFRPDRAREISVAIADPAFAEFDRGAYRTPRNYTTMTRYERTFPYPVAYAPQDLSGILPEILAGRGMKQFRVAETEKYAHITFFFNGGREIAYPGEDRALIASPQDVATYDEKPEMSAYEVTDALVKAIETGTYDFILVNYANHDMVGHTGNIPATVRAAEVLDECLGRVHTAVAQQGGVLLITADHGNSEQMIDPATHTPHTAHTTNEVHFVMAGEGVRDLEVRNGILADIAPTILDLLGLERPQEMSGRSLVVR